MFRQIISEWKENLWLVIELAIVACIVWYLTAVLRQQYLDYNMPRGFDAENVYLADVNVAFEGDSRWIDMGDSTTVNDNADLWALLNSISELPSVEAAAFGTFNAPPYNYSFRGDMVRIEEWPDTMGIYVNTKYVTPDFPKVFRLTSLDGSKSPEDLSDMLAGRMDVIYGRSRGFERMDHPILRQDTLTGKILASGLPGFRIGAVTETIRRSDYEFSDNGMLIGAFTPGNPYMSQFISRLCVRVKPGQADEFVKAMRTDRELLRRRNISFSNLAPIETHRITLQWKDEANRNRYIAGGALLLFIVLIGLLGTFWGRVYSRTSSIAVRKVFGATDLNIFGNLVGEALLFLTLAYVPASLLMWKGTQWLSESLFSFVNRWEWTHNFIWAGVISFVIMAVMILIGVGIPAWRAMHIQPAEALKEE